MVFDVGGQGGRAKGGRCCQEFQFGEKPGRRVPQQPRQLFLHQAGPGRGGKVLRPDGILVSASCSYHMPREALQDAMLRATRRVGRGLQILEQGHQGPDHPVHPAIPETAYLKAFIGRVG